MDLMSSSKWASRWTSLKDDPLAFLSAKASQATRLAEDRYHEFVLSRRVGLEFLTRRPADAIKPDFCDLQFLYDQVRAKHPRLVFEFGSGCSTVLIAQALHENAQAGHPGRILSFETDRGWAGVTQGSLPAHLGACCEVRFSELVEQSFGGDLLYVHKAVPDEIPDFMYLDGPALNDRVTGAGDLLLMEERLIPGFSMVVDGRWRNVATLRRELRRRWDYSARRRYNNSLFELIG